MTKFEGAALHLLRTDLTLFIEQVFNTLNPADTFELNWHIELLAEYLKGIETGDIKRLIVNIAPRSLKSVAVSIAFPAWVLGVNPSTRIICASYSQHLSESLSDNCRKILESDWYRKVFPNTVLSPTQNTKKFFATTQGGYRYSTSVGGTITGFGADIICFDDLLSADEASSLVYRKKVVDWFNSSLSSRLNNKKTGRIIGIEQRLHEDDLTGNLLKQGVWTHLKLPMVAEMDELLEYGKVKHFRKNGTLLQESRFGWSEVDFERDKNPYNFSSQYQQRPAPLGGGEFKKEWLTFYEKANFRDMNTYIFVDPARETKPNSDYTAMIVIGLSKDMHIYILDVVRERLQLSQRQEKLFYLHEKYTPLQVFYQKNAAEADLDYMKLVMDRITYHFRITAINVPSKLSKNDRIRRLQPYFINGRIWLPKYLWKVDEHQQPIDLIDIFVNQEYLLFPVSKHDDMIDALATLCDVNMQYPSRASQVNYHELYNNLEW